MRRLPVNRFSTDDLPALERPAKAISGPVSGGHCDSFAALFRKLAARRGASGAGLPALPPLPVGFPDCLLNLLSGLLKGAGYCIIRARQNAGRPELRGVVATAVYMQV